MTNDILTISEAAEYAKVQKQAIWVAIKKKRLPAERSGKTWLIKKDDLDFYRLNKYSRQMAIINGERIFNPDKDTFSTFQIAKLFSHLLKRPFSISYVYFLIRTGSLKAEKLGRYLIINGGDALSYLEKNHGYKESSLECQETA